MNMEMAYIKSRENKYRLIIFLYVRIGTVIDMIRIRNFYFTEK